MENEHKLSKPEKIVSKLRQVEVLIGKGMSPLIQPEISKLLNKSITAGANSMVA